MPKELTEEDWAALAEALLPENVERTFRQEQQPERDMAILTDEQIRECLRDLDLERRRGRRRKGAGRA